MAIMARLSKRKLPNGVLPAARKFDVSHSTVRVNIKNYKEAKFENDEHRKRPRKNRGAKTLPPSKLDDKVLQMKKKYETSRVCPQLHFMISNNFSEELALPKDKQQQQNSLCFQVFGKRWVSAFIRLLKN